MDNSQSQKCKVCQEIKLLSEFPLYLKKDKTYSHRKYCKDCSIVKKRKHYKDNKDSILEANKSWREQNQNIIKDLNAKTYLSNKESIAKSNSLPNNKVKNKINKKNNYYKDLTLSRAKVRKYRRNSKNSKKNAKARYLREKENPLLKLRRLVSNSILKKITKNDSCLKYLSYSIKELKEHLELLFSSVENLYNGEVWMNWNNHGSYKVESWDDNDCSTWTWNIDHIIPHSSFNYKSMDDEEFKKCWSLENLRPYSAKKNIIEGNRKNV